MICVDDNGGTMFNHRRQSQDRVLRDHILKLVGSAPLWMSPYSASQFAAEEQRRIKLTDQPLQSAGDGEFCLVEGEPLMPYETQLELVVLFRWNRVYPADTYFDIPLGEHGWNLVKTSKFPGYSHEEITEEVYRK